MTKREGPPSVTEPGEGGFLSRWSRLKREAGNTAAPPRAADAAPSEAGAPPVEAAPPEDEEERRRELEELIARLPRIEEIGAATDVTGFLDRRIPDALRNAALRAAWSADPAVRDFLNDAREYALDYTAQGAAPGYGPLTDSDDLRATLAQIFGGDGDTSTTLVESDTFNKNEVSVAMVDANIVALQTESPPVPGGSSGGKSSEVELQSVRLSDASQATSKAQDREKDRHDAAAQAAETDPCGPCIQPMPRRRGGGALPV